MPGLVDAYTVTCKLHLLIGKNGYLYVKIHAIIHLRHFSKCSCEAKMLGKAVVCWSLNIWRPSYGLQWPYLWVPCRRPSIHTQVELLSWKQMDAYNSFQSEHEDLILLSVWAKQDGLNSKWILVKGHLMTCKWHGLFQKQMAKLSVHTTHVWEGKQLRQCHSVVY